MAMLNYLGAQPGPGLSMPDGMPGSGAPTDPTMPAGAASAMMGGAGGPPPMPPGGPAVPPGGAGPGFPPVGMTDAAGRQYDAVTQEDGSVLLHLKNPDGSRGPAVKLIPPLKARKG